MPVGEKPFRVELVTPSAAFAPMTCTFASVPAWDGEIGFLSGRAPLVCKLGAGELRVEQGGSLQRYFVQGGFAEMLDDVLTVLTEQAAEAADLEAGEATSELEAALHLQGDSEAEREIRQEKVARARGKLLVIRRRDNAS